MVKILASLKNLCAKGFSLIQKLKPATRIVYLPEYSLLCFIMKILEIDCLKQTEISQN